MENEDSFFPSVIVRLQSTRIAFLVHLKGRFSKTVFSSLVFFVFVTAVCRFRVDRRKERVLNTVMSCIIQRLPGEAFNVYSQEP